MNEFFDTAASQFIQAMIYYNQQTGELFEGDKLIDIVNKLNSRENTKAMIMFFTFPLEEGANMQVSGMIEAIKEKWEKEYLKTLDSKK